MRSLVLTELIDLSKGKIFCANSSLISLGNKENPLQKSTVNIYQARLYWINSQKSEQKNQSELTSPKSTLTPQYCQLIGNFYLFILIRFTLR